MHIPGTAIPQTAGASIGPNLIVKVGSADHTVIAAAAATDKLIGVTPPTITNASGSRVDVIIDGVVEVKAGGTCTRGGPATSDASGQAVDAAPSAGVNNGVIGFFLNSGVSGDLVSVRLAPHTLQG